MKPRASIGLLVGVATLLVALVALTVDHAVRRSEGAAAIAQRLRLASDALAPDAATLFALAPEQAYATIRRWSALSGFRVTLIDANGDVHADSWAFFGPLPRLENHGRRPEVTTARIAGVGVGRRRSATTGRVTTYLAHLVGPPGHPLGFLRLAQEDPADESPWAGTLAAFAAALVAGAVASRWERRRHDAVARHLAAWTDLPADAGLEAIAGDVDRRFRALREGLTREVEATRAALDQVAEGIVLLDREGVVRYANSAASTLLGGTPATGHALVEAVRIPEVLSVVHEVLAGGGTRHTSATGADGLELAVRAAALSHPVLAAAVVLTDVRGERQLERARRALVADLAHELRTPLTVLTGLTEELSETGANAELAATLGRQVHKLRAFAQDLEELARIESGQVRLDLAETDAAAVVRQVLAELGAGAREAGVALRQDGGPAMVRTDPVRLAQVLANLVDNGIRYNRTGGCVTVTTGNDERGVRIEVADDGLGIPAAEIPLVFQRFYRVRRQAERTGGNGLGLAIVKHLAHALGGTVTLASREGAGTTVTVVLPAAGPVA